MRWRTGVVGHAYITAVHLCTVQVRWIIILKLLGFLNGQYV